MSSGNVRDLLVRLSLDVSKFQENSTSARKYVTMLESDFKRISTDTSIEDGAAALKENLQSQLEAVRKQAELYQGELDTLKAKLDAMDPGGKTPTGLLNQVTRVENALNKSLTHANELETKLKKFDAQHFVDAMRSLSGALNDMSMAYDGLIGDWASETADGADEISVARESALAAVYKIAEGRPGVDDQWMDELENFNQKLTTIIPVTYQELAKIEQNAMQAGGVAAENVMAFTEMFARLEKSTDIVGESGAQQFGKFLTVTQASADEYERLGSATVALGNNMAATESTIVATATRAASAMRAAGISAADTLGIASSALALGMEEAAAASSMEKLAEKLGTSAQFAASGYTSFLEAARAWFPQYQSIYEMKVWMDSQSSDIRKGFVGAMGMTEGDLNEWMKIAMLAEKYAEALGMSVEGFAQYWQQDAGLAFAEFFQTIGQMDEVESSSLMHVLHLLEVDEIRESRLARNFALVNDNLLGAILLAREAYEENDALQKESDRLFSTTESKRQINANKTENALAAMGETVKNLRQPFDDFFANVKQGFADMPEWVHTGAGLITQAFSTAGGALDKAGDLAMSFYYLAQARKTLGEVPWKDVGSALGKALPAVGKFGAGAGIAALMGVGLYELTQVLSNAAADTTEISQNLASLEIHIDESSKNATLQAIAQVKAAVEGLSAPEEDYSATSRIVQMGYGTENMFAKALAYEQAIAEKGIEEIYADYGNKIREQEQELLKETASEADRMLIQGRIEALEREMKAEVEAAQRAYGQTLNSLISGGIAQNEEAAAALTRLGEKYDIMRLLYEAAGIQSASGISAARDFVFSQGVNDALNALGLSAFGNVGSLSTLNIQNAIADLYGLLAQDVETVVTENGGLMGLFLGAMEGGAFDQANIEGADGLFLRLLQAMDIKRLGELGAKDWRDIGENSMGGLAEGITTANGEAISAVETTANDLLQAARDVLQIHSPSLAFQEIGGYAVEGLAEGILSQKDAAVDAMRQVMAAVIAEAEFHSARIGALLQWTGAVAGAGGVIAGGGGGAVSGGSTITQYFNVSGVSLDAQQNIKRLAQEVAKVQRNVNASVGKG